MPGEDYVRYSGRVFDHEEGLSLVSAALEFWLTTGDYAKKLEDKLAKYIGLRYSLLTNSGSSTKPASNVDVDIREIIGDRN